MKMIIAGLLASTMMVGTAEAANVLYRNDSNQGTDYMAQALGGLGYTVTATNGNLSSFTLSSFDIVVYANQGNGVPGGDTASLNAFLSGGGRVIFTNWTTEAPALGATFSGTTNQTSLTVGALFGTGLTNPLAVTNPGWGVFSRGLALTDGTSAGTFGNSEHAIVVGNGGRSIFNGFLTDTVDSSTLYRNQLTYLAGFGAVPEPQSWAMLIAGFGLVGATMRRRKAALAA